MVENGQKANTPGNFPRLQKKSNQETGWWDRIENKHFKLRSGKNYRRNHAKEKSRDPFYEVIAVDVYKTNRKIECFGDLVDFEKLNKIYEEQKSNESDSGSAPEKSESKDNSNSDEYKDTSDEGSSTEERMLNNLMKNSGALKPQNGVPDVSCGVPSDDSNMDNEVLKDISLVSLETSDAKSQKTDSESSYSVEMESTVEETQKLPKWLIISVLLPEKRTSSYSKNRSGKNVFVLYGRLDEDVLEKAISKNHPSVALLEALVQGKTPKSSLDKKIRKRFKVVAKALNPAEINVMPFVSKLIGKYNAKPFMARTSSSFYRKKEFFEVNVDIGKFSYVSLIALNAMRSAISLVRLGLGFVVQSEADEEMPEQLLMSLEISKPNLENAPIL